MTGDVEGRENPAAFPSGDHRWVEPGHGMTLRDWFAGQALPTMIDLVGGLQSIAICDEPKEAARRSYAIADAMLAERAKALSSTGDG